MFFKSQGTSFVQSICIHPASTTCAHEHTHIYTHCFKLLRKDKFELLNTFYEPGTVLSILYIFHSSPSCSQTPMPYAQMPAVGTWPLPEHCNPPQHCYVFHSQVLSPPPCGPLLPDRHMVQWPASPLSSCSYVYREAVSPSSPPFTCSQAAREP